MRRDYRAIVLVAIACCLLFLSAAFAGDHDHGGDGLNGEMSSGEMSDEIALSYRAAESAYRASEMLEAKVILEGLLDRRPDHGDAALLLGYVYYSLEAYEKAERLFHGLLSVMPEAPDLYYGLALTTRNLGRLKVASYYAGLAQRLAPEREDIVALRQALPPRDTERLPLHQRPRDLVMPFVAKDGYFRRADGNPLMVRGVNLGLALPGKFPTEFPQARELYDDWLRLLAEMNANVVRLHTIVPPVFYEALRDYNVAHPEKPLYLLQGVWTEPPGAHAYHGVFQEDFLAEAYRVVDLVHGNAVITPRPSHAAGVYDADVSPWLLGIILGREWEPRSVRAFNEQAGAPRSYQGEHLRVKESSAMEAWLAEVMDRVSVYQLRHYNQQTPVAFTSWPPLDPLYHPTETSPEEEDKSSVDARKITATRGFQAGHFAVYHAYPYDPDFLLLELDSLQPRSTYMAYLERLKAHHGSQPVLIGEFGVPSSRGLARFQPQGYHQGGLNEAGQATVNAKLYKEISDSGMAGGVVFAWLDEWFKLNWLFDELERPREHVPRWHSVMNPEQNYGLISFDAEGDIALRGNAADWQKASLVAQKGGLSLRAHATPSHLHLLVTGLSLQTALLEIDTHPAPGPEFRVALGPTGGRLWINAGYQFYKNQAEREDVPPSFAIDLAARPVPGAGWAPWLTQPQRERRGRDGTVFPDRLDEPGQLRPGRDPFGGRDVQADYLFSEAGLHLRLPWTLLGVTDPSAAAVFDGASPGRSLHIAGIGVLYRSRGLVLEGRYHWPHWQQPDYLYRLKPAYYALKALWAEKE